MFRRALMVLGLGAVVTALPSAASPFADLANTDAGRAAYGIGAVTVDPGSAEAWTLDSVDIVPFDYEQGYATSVAGELVFNARGTLYRTTRGCTPDGACYDELAVNRTPISREEGAAGFNHIGDTSVGLAGPAAGLLFTPLEKSPGNGVDRKFKVFDATTLATVGVLDMPGPFHHHSWVMVDPTGRYLVNADESILHLEVYEISRDANGGVHLARAPHLDVHLSSALDMSDVGPTGCDFVDRRTVYCADWRKDQLKRDLHTDFYRFDLTAPIGARAGTGTVTKAFTYEVEHVIPTVPYGLEAEGITFYDGMLHIAQRNQRLDAINLLHFAPPASAPRG